MANQYNKIDYSFSAAPLHLVLKDISRRADINIVWSADINDEQISGRFVQAPVNEIMQSIADSYNFNFYQTGSIFCLSKSDNEVKYYGIVKSSIEKETLQISEVDIVHFGNINIIVGKRRDVMNAISTIAQLQTEITRGFNCELNIVKVSKELNAKLQANINSLGYNLAAGFPSLDKFLEVKADWGIKDTELEIVQRPLLYLSDGNKAKFKIGSTRTLERRTTSEFGYTSTSGYDEKSDGFELELLASYLRENICTVSVKIRQSLYRETLASEKEALPVNDTQEIDSPCIFCRFDRWYLVASLDEKKKDKTVNFLGFQTDNKDFVFLVFLRVCSVNLNNSNYSY